MSMHVHGLAHLFPCCELCALTFSHKLDCEKGARECHCEHINMLISLALWCVAEFTVDS